MSSSTSTSGNSNENNEDTPATPYEVQKHDILFSSTTCYQVLDFNGEGSFGKVAKCLNLMTGNQVAVKIHKDSEDVSKVIQEEVKMLEAIRCLDPDKNNIVNFIEDFRFNNLSCLAFEMLDRSLWDLMEERGWIPLSLNEIRPVIQQLMVAFDALKSIGILHTDLKPDNIMLVNHQDQPFKIKLIDFGLARRVSEVRIGTMMQPSSFRAPEVTLGLPLTEAVDMWGVGCIMAFLYFGRELFPRECSYNLIRTIVHLLGQPADHLLSAGVYTWAYFSQNGDPHRWRLKLPEEFQEVTGIQAQLMFTFFDFVENLEDAVQKYPAKKTDIEYDDRMAFLSLLKSTFELDPERRVTPRDSLKNPFLSMVHLKNKMDTSSYADEALQCMTILPLNHLDSESESDYSGDSLLNFRDGDNTKTTDPTKPSLHFDETCSEKRPSTPVFCGEDLPQVDYEELQVADIINKEKFTNELQAEKNKNKLLQEEMEQLCISYQLLIARYEDDVPKIRKQADALQRNLDNEILQKNHLQSDFDEAIAALQEEREKNKTLQNQLDKTGQDDCLNEVNLSYRTDVIDVRQQADTLRSDLERKLEQKILLQTAYEDLQEAHKLSQEMFSVQLDAEKEKNKILKQDLDKICTSHCEINQRYETDVIMVTQQANTLQHEPDKETKSHADSALHNLRAEQEAEEITILHQNAFEKEKISGRELDELKTQLSVQSCVSLNLKLSTELKAEREAPQKITSHDDDCEDEPNKQHESISNAKLHEPTKEAEVPEEMPCEQQETISLAPALESQRGAEGNLPQRAAEPPSVWKRVRHFLGLRKPKRWKKKKEG